MSAQLEAIRQKEFVNQPVLKRPTFEEMGRVEVLWTYPQKHRVLGFICKSGFLGRTKAAFTLAQVQKIAPGGVIVKGEPQPTDAARVAQLISLLNHEVYSEGGERLGKITDCLFNLRTGAITYYLLTSSGWRGAIDDIYQLAPTQIVGFDRQQIIVPDYAAARLDIYQEGLPQRLTEVGETLREEALREWRSLTRRAESVTGEARDRWLSLAEQAKERAQTLSQQAREKAQTLSEQLKEGTQTFVEQAQEKGQSFAEQVKEQAQAIQQNAAPSSRRGDRQDAEDEWDDDSFENPFDRYEEEPESPQSPPDATAPSPSHPSTNHLYPNINDDFGAWDDDFSDQSADQAIGQQTGTNQSVSFQVPSTASNPSTPSNSNSSEDDPWSDVETSPVDQPPSQAQPPQSTSTTDDDEPWI